MALVHNMMIRGLNSIYLQAPHIAPKDERSFCQYISQWYRLVDIHHSGEEAEFFPQIEKLTGEKGIMDVNLNQHHAFHDGLEAFVAHFRACLAGEVKYDGNKIIAMIDGFGK